jgi:hypothetical protein
VSEKRSKKLRILEYRQAHSLERAGAPEIQAIRAELGRALGRPTSASYVANVLREAGVRVDYKDPYVAPALEEPYASHLEGVLKFRNLGSAEASLHRLDALYREYQAAPDRVGMRLARALALKGKQRAESLAERAGVSAAKRQEKREIAGWFRVWLESPELFSDWLELRKQSEEFRSLFPDCDAGLRRERMLEEDAHEA